LRWKCADKKYIWLFRLLDLFWNKRLSSRLSIVCFADRMARRDKSKDSSMLLKRSEAEYAC
jgi:hypothetical protein